MAAQILGATANSATNTSQHRARLNPHPPCVIRDGNATNAVLKLLGEPPKRCWCHYEIVEATRRSRVAVDWALIFLRNKGLIECAPDSRNAQYLRYRAVSVT